LVAGSGDLGTTAASCEGGSSTIGASVTGAVEGNFFRSSSSLIKEAKVEHSVQAEQKEELKKKLVKKTHELRASKSSTPSSRTGASMVTFFRVDVLEDKNSSTCFFSCPGWGLLSVQEEATLSS
jgi:hypothetical protein